MTHVSTGDCPSCGARIRTRPLCVHDPETGHTLCPCCEHVYIQTMPRAIEILRPPAFRDHQVAASPEVFT